MLVDIIAKVSQDPKIVFKIIYVEKPEDMLSKTIFGQIVDCEDPDFITVKFTTGTTKSIKKSNISTITSKIDKAYINTLNSTDFSSNSNTFKEASKND